MNNVETRRKAKDMSERVYVLSMEVTGPDGADYAGWTSVHRTYAGAERRLRERAEEWGVAQDLEADRTGEEFTAADIETGHQLVSYGISHLPVEE